MTGAEKVTFGEDEKRRRAYAESPERAIDRSGMAETFCRKCARVVICESPRVCQPTCGSCSKKLYRK